MLPCVRYHSSSTNAKAIENLNSSIAPNFNVLYTCPIGREIVTQTIKSPIKRDTPRKEYSQNDIRESGSEVDHLGLKSKLTIKWVQQIDKNQSGNQPFLFAK